MATLFSDFLSKYISYHQFWCIYQHRLPSTSLWLKAWLRIGPWIHVLVNVIILIISTIYEKKIFTQGSSLSKFVDVIQLVFPVCLHTLVVVEAFLKSDCDRQMEAIVHSLERNFEQSGSDLKPFNRRLKWRFVLLAITVQVICLLVEIYIIATITPSPDWVRNWMARIFSFAYSRIAIFHYVFLAEYISSRLSVVNANLHELANESRQAELHGRVSLDQYLIVRVVQLKDTHLQLWQLLDLHNRRHSVFVLGTMTSFFVCLTIDFYWMYANVYYGDNIFILRKFFNKLSHNQVVAFDLILTEFSFPMAESFLCGIPPILSLIGIFIPSQMLIQTANGLGYNLHLLRRSFRGQRIATVVRTEYVNI